MATDGARATVVLVVGRPASGKTTIAVEVAERWRLPLVSKDVLKEILFDAIGAGDANWSMRLGRAAFMLLDHVIELQLQSGSSFVVDAAYNAKFENAKWRAWQKQYGFAVIQVHCTAPHDELIRRMSERAESGNRHRGHADADRITEFRRSLDEERAETIEVDGEVLCHRSADEESRDAILRALESRLVGLPG